MFPSILPSTLSSSSLSLSCTTSPCSNSKTILLFKIIVERILLSTTQDKNAKEWENFRMLQLQKKIKKEKMKTKRGGILDWRWWVELVMI
jgi:hypothetical protein